jgi:hypothetical protein
MMSFHQIKDGTLNVEEAMVIGDDEGTRSFTKTTASIFYEEKNN